MTQEEVIAMALESKILEPIELLEGNQWRQDTLRELEAFAKLVRNDYSNKHAQLWLKRIDEAVKAEREACAQIAETPISGEQDDITMEAKDRVAKAIRARSNT